MRRFVPARRERKIIAEPLGRVLEVTGYLADGGCAVSFRLGGTAG